MSKHDMVDDQFLRDLIIIETRDPQAAQTLLSNALEFALTHRERLYARMRAVEIENELRLTRRT